MNTSMKETRVEERLISYLKVYENRRSKEVEVKKVKEREPSKEKPDINASSGNIVE